MIFKGNEDKEDVTPSLINKRNKNSANFCHIWARYKDSATGINDIWVRNNWKRLTGVCNNNWISMVRKSIIQESIVVHRYEAMYFFINIS